MKQGINFEMPVKFEIDLNLVSKIVFKFYQFGRLMYAEYPSSKVEKIDDNTVKLFWTYEDTYKFLPSKEIQMDTKVYLKDSNINPETNIVSIKLNPTLFKQGEEDDIGYN